MHRVYADLLAVPPELSAHAFWPAFEQSCYRQHRPVFDAIATAFGSMLGPGGLPALAAAGGPASRRAIERLVRAQPGEAEQRCAGLLAACWPARWGEPPPLYLSTLFGLAPAATLTVDGRPAIIIGLERFLPDGAGHPALASPAAGSGRAYHLDDLAEMIPHEACHAARANALQLTLLPAQLPLLDLIALEGTALWFTDQYLNDGRQTLRTFLPAADWERHQAAEERLLAEASADLHASGAAVFLRHFSSTAPVSGYYLGWAVCRRYLQRQGGDATDLATLPSAALWCGAGLPWRYVARTDTMEGA